jgi:HEPN domain-containing protein
LIGGLMKHCAIGKLPFDLMSGKQNVFALFAFHLTIEKLLKAIWVKDNIENTPPRQHDLTFIYN